MAYFKLDRQAGLVRVKNFTILFALVLASLFIGVFATQAQEADMASEEAIAALNRFLAAWNNADIVQLRKELHYPHITHTPRGLVIANTPEEFSTDFDELKAQGWARSSFDKFTSRQSSSNKVHVEVLYSRYNAAGETYDRGYVYYVVTKQDGKWAMQYRAPGAIQDETLPEPERQAAQEAVRTVGRFFSAFNAADNPLLLDVNHVPQLMLNDTTSIYADSAESGIVTVDFPALRERENWHRSDIDYLQVINATLNHVVIELAFNRYHPDGEKYRTVPAVWVLSRKANRWGIEFRSLMAPSFSR
jgi:hypothetical protein